MEANPVKNLCTGGCGFYGSPATNGFCSLCYKKKQQQSPTASTTPVPSSQVGTVSTASALPTVRKANLSSPKESQADKEAEENTNMEASASSANTEDTSDGKEADKDGKKKKNRCVSCRKKVGLTGFECRCGGLFCSAHRYSDKHDCQFDYRGVAAEEIRRKNPTVVGEKVQKI